MATKEEKKKLIDILSGKDFKMEVLHLQLISRQIL